MPDTKKFAVAFVSIDMPLKLKVVEAEDWFQALNLASENAFTYLENDQDMKAAQLEAFDPCDTQFEVLELPA